MGWADDEPVESWLEGISQVDALLLLDTGTEDAVLLSLGGLYTTRGALATTALSLCALVVMAATVVTMVAVP